MIYWNLVAIVTLRKKVFLMYHVFILLYFGEFSYDVAAFVIPSKYGVFGEGFWYFSSGNMKEEIMELGTYHQFF
jgi:hypothetical protein